MDKKDLDQFHYHDRSPAIKKVDGIILVPKIKKVEPIIPSGPPAELVPTEEKIPVNPRIKSNKFLSAFIAICLIFLFSILPIRILESSANMNIEAKESSAKLEDAYQAIQNNNYEQAKSDFISINNNVEEINKELSDIGQKNIFVSRFLPLSDSTMNDERLFETILALSKIGSRLIDDFNLNGQTNISGTNQNGLEDLLSLNNFSKLNRDLASVKDELNIVKLNIVKIDDSKMSDKEKQYFSLIKQNMGSIDQYYNSALALSEKASSLLGDDYDKKYLVLFQNNTEIRATGGFPGTYGIITVGNGRIKNTFIDSIYNPDGQITKMIEPPDPLKKITPNWTMRDANWYPDFPSSAKNVSNFYEMEGGFTPDGIIAFDTKPFLDLLGLTGPIELPKYGVEINQDNFISVTQYKTSIDYDPSQNNPKKFLADFAPLFLDKLSALNSEKQNEAIKILLNDIAEKHIQFYSSTSDVESAFEQINIAGQIQEQKDDSDYFAYINSNIGGLKTNLEITDSLSHQITLDKNSSLVHRVELKRVYAPSKSNDINYAYLRFYLPLGSKVLDVQNFEKKDSIKRDSATGMIYLESAPDKYLGKASVSDLDIYEESGKTVVGGWQAIGPGEELDSSITYLLPKQVKISNGDYNILIQKQSGVLDQNTDITINDLTNKIKGEASTNLKKDETLSIPLN